MSACIAPICKPVFLGTPETGFRLYATGFVPGESVYNDELDAPYDPNHSVFASACEPKPHTPAPAITLTTAETIGMVIEYGANILAAGSTPLIDVVCDLMDALSTEPSETDAYDAFVVVSSDPEAEAYAEFVHVSAEECNIQ